MAIPDNATGGGNINATQVFKISFSKACSTKPLLEAYDNTETFPAVDEYGETTANEIFTGTTESPIPMLAGYSGGLEGEAAPPGALWHPAAATPGADNPNLLEGTTSYVECENVPAEAGNTVLNLSLYVPFDATVPSDVEMNALVQVRYTYTGDPPVLTFEYNDGTEELPNWVTFVPGTNGVRFCNSGTVPPVYKLTLPAEGSVYAGELWVTE